MAKLGDPESVEAIRAAIYPTTPDDLEATALAVQIIGEIQDRGSVGNLVALAAIQRQGNHMPAEIRLGSALAAAKMGDAGGTFLAEDYVASPVAAIRAQAAAVLGWSAAPEAAGALRRLLGDPDPLVRVAAAAALVDRERRLSEMAEMVSRVVSGGEDGG